jgi:hypothetical protein
MYETQYIQLVIDKAKTDKKLAVILENYLLNNIDFIELNNQIDEQSIDIQSYHNFKKSNDIDSLINS